MRKYTHLFPIPSLVSTDQVQLGLYSVNGASLLSQISPHKGGENNKWGDTRQHRHLRTNRGKLNQNIRISVVCHDSPLKSRNVNKVNSPSSLGILPPVYLVALPVQQKRILNISSKQQYQMGFVATVITTSKTIFWDETLKKDMMHFLQF